VASPTPASDVTRDGFLGGAVHVFQPATGYRAGHDAVLLAASLSGEAGETLAEAGCGAGAALLCAAHRLPGARFTGFELDRAALDLCIRGVAENRLADRVDAIEADIRVRSEAFENRFTQSFCNPPFFEPGAIRPPARARHSAYVAEAPLREWVLFLHHVTAPRGRITLIHRAAALAEVLELLAPRTGEIEVLPVRPAPGAPASRVLVRARKGLRRGPLRLYDGLALHETAGGVASDRAAAILRGGALEWR
jgi:tRNA1Val (adenine37-N6)-methyltransferase